MKTNCIRCYEFGDPKEVLKVEQKERQAPINDEVLVRMLLRPINPSDLIPITGAYSHRISLPTIPGYEGVGIVEDVGPNASKELIGKRVLALRGEGTWQDFVTTSSDFVVQVPHSIDDYTAAQLYINPLTAWLLCTEVLKLQPEDSLLVNACSSAIGRILVQLSKIIGFRLIAVTRNDAHKEDLLKLGASNVINSSETPLYQKVMSLTNGQGVNYAIDSIGGPSGTELAYCIQPQGTLVTIGLLSGIPIDWRKISNETNIQIKLFHLRHWNKQVSAQTWQETFKNLFSLIVDRKLTLMEPQATFELTEVNKAISFAESQLKNKGKVFLK
ncbi:zinc-dependent alcohol dehydrogenase family protein [Bacillus sp. RG28]|uniref:Zinc-dependent alcohol dehydrogenase family protein n=1 Tax=Gottfriedia endophytica TaxID=2820819 RepID=A0A940NMG7_9BACI|nr:zinc-dependent alcohol dehydrogenase family protein [Gottfriedia endophytica]MBP0725271.1 zinc-dependent alcohol dehydrogenase family protein [Gottfriedia endophytica]